MTAIGGMRLRAVGLLGAAGLIVSLLTGCSPEPPYGSDKYSAEMDVARRFMSALEDGAASSAVALTTGDLGIRLDATTDRFYESAVARPSKSTIVSAVETSDTEVYVDVRFQLAGDDRDVKLGFTRGQSSPRIGGWLFQGMSVAGHTGSESPGSLVISDRLDYPIGRDMQQIVLLPGRYSFHYQGSGPAAGKSFPVGFPYHDDELAPHLPHGLSVSHGSLTVDDAG